MNQIHIYFKHPIAKPKIIDVEDIGESSRDDYESAIYEVYRPPLVLKNNTMKRMRWLRDQI